MKKIIKKAQEDSCVMMLFAAVCFLLGIVVGVLASPVKNGLSIGSNNTIIGGDDDDEDEELDGYGFDDDEDIKF